MASTNKRSWKLQDFTAHDSNVNCVSLGHKSGRVLVTGGDDKKVNLWAVGKSTCFMSLSGHTTPVECVQFNHLEEQVCAGSTAGTLKVWDLEAAKLLRTMTGHKYAIKTIDFHPYSDYLASGSADSTIKMWDSRKKGCILTYDEHKATVNSLKFSPDGNWIASGGDDASVKIWDLRVGRVIKEFDEHAAPVTCVQYHPNEFLLASGGKDRSVQIYDLENFTVVSSESDAGSVRCLCFHPDGECLFAGQSDYMKVLGWEPTRVHDTLFVDWGRVSDLSSAQNQLIGASFHLTNVQIYVVDLKKVKPLAKTTEAVTSPFTPNTSGRRSFSKAERPVALKTKSLSKTIEESTSGTDPEEDTSANITNLSDYEEIFKGRSHPTQPQKLVMMDSFEALSLDNSINNYRNTHIPTQYSRSKSNLEQIYDNNKAAKGQEERENFLPNINKTNLHVPKKKITGINRQSSCQDERVAPKNNFNIRQSLSDANITKNNNQKTVKVPDGFATRNNNQIPPRNLSRKGSFSRTREAVPAIKIGRSVPAESENISMLSSRTSDIYIPSKLLPDEPVRQTEYIPGALDKPVGLNIDDFLPKNHPRLGFPNQMTDISEAELLKDIMSGHEPMISVIASRQRSLNLVANEFKNKDIKAALEMAVAMGDLHVLVDILGVFNDRYSIWSLDLCVCILPKVEELLLSKYEPYILTGLNTLKLILRHFGPVIKSNVQSPAGSFGVDIPREERYRKSIKCHEVLLSLRSLIAKKQSAPGNVGAAFKEVNSLMQIMFD
ncbi:katanin p80 WD40 repeat-containing subunit B1 isoform X2 [Coccinella septempunctata]|uniref:katanin p80 WD40 repeat-containing subunit B1 isoform X2 n=1 Tax=Coccinella septempunctata TaxID=41139 RepID=UPI001D08AB7F|nr:katanin p80 WD40 repeat-containing subunit B1 isoform X2 [Coccinella septempunctata]